MSTIVKLGLAVAATAAFVVPSTASAAPTCTYNAATDTVNLQLDAPAPNGAYTLSRAGNFIVWRNGRPGAAAFGCGGATVFNTDAIRVRGTVQADDLVIDLSQGAFAPGVTPEPGSIDEIEIGVDLLGPANKDVFEVSGSDGNDYVASGLAGGMLNVSLNPDGDADVLVNPALRNVCYFGLAGNDLLGVAGIHLGIAPYNRKTNLEGGSGNDELWGGTSKDTMVGGSGTDFFSAGAGKDSIFAADGNAETVDTGAGVDVVAFDALDTVI